MITEDLENAAAFSVRGGLDRGVVVVQQGECERNHSVPANEGRTRSARNILRFRMEMREYDQFNVESDVVSLAALILVPLTGNGILNHQSVVATAEREKAILHNGEWSGIHGGYGLVDGGLDFQHELLVAVKIGQLGHRKGRIVAV